VLIVALLRRDDETANGIIDRVETMEAEFDRFSSWEKTRMQTESMRRVAEYSAGICENVLNLPDLEKSQP
jgi:hypothetical protein